jgi:hypothetical protein
MEKAEGLKVSYRLRAHEHLWKLKKAPNEPAPSEEVLLAVLTPPGNPVS